ncbi:MAG: hypothetical protein PVI26_01490 [Chitinispirillia bacterium]|jgi:hypothetical protein
MNKKIVKRSQITSDTLCTEQDSGLCQKEEELHDLQYESIPKIDSIDDSIQNGDNCIPVVNWIGKKFRLLEKTKMFQKFGYELYTTPQLSQTAEKVNSDIALPNFRIKYKPFKGKTLIVSDVKETDDGEYLITFNVEEMDLTVYGKTRKEIIEGIVLIDDFISAEKRWKGKTVYSRKRSIEIFDSTASRFSAERVSITEPLDVVSIRWGITPLPPKSLWIVVEGNDNLNGIIPINFSWTNVLKEEKVQGAPWEREIFENDPRKLYQWDDYIWQTIDKHSILMGMTTRQVQVSWGDPDKILKETVNNRGVIKYIYQGKTLLFENDTLISASE